MKIGNIREFSFNTSEGIDTIVISYNADEVGDEVTSDTYLEITGLSEGQQVSAIGYTLNNSDGVAMKFASMSGFDIAEVVEEDGIYLILSSALERLELTSNSNAHLIIKQVV